MDDHKLSQNPPAAPEAPVTTPATSHKKRKIRLFWIIVALAVLIIMFMLMSFVVQILNTPSPIGGLEIPTQPVSQTPISTITVPQPTPETLDSGWMKYRLGNMSMNLPSDWHQEPGNSPYQFVNYDVSSAPGRGFDASQDQGLLKIEVYTYFDEPDTTLPLFVKKKIAEGGLFDNSKAPQKETTVGGQPAILLESAGPGFVYYLKNPESKKFMMISFTLDFDNYQGLAQEIINTIQFNTFQAVDQYKCTQDSDCVMVPQNVCACTGGGKNTAINKQYEAEWVGKIEEDQKVASCPGVMSNHWSCTGNPKPQCIQNKCQLVEQR